MDDTGAAVVPVRCNGDRSLGFAYDRSMPVPAALPHPMPSGVWHLRTLGAIQARNGDIPLGPIPSRPMAALLARLALAPDQDHPREALAELLWPGVEPAAARNRLRNALSVLNKLLAVPGQALPEVIDADRRSLRLPAQRLRCDALDFEAHVRAGRIDAARACWQGEFMPGHYDEWVVEERLRLQALYDRFCAPETASAAALTAPAPQPWRQLPLHGNAFFGREAELQFIAQELASSRELWITGPSGSGKSRLAAQFGAMARGFDAIVWVPLLACKAPQQVIEQVRAALGLHAAPVLPLEQIAARLQGLETLLVLDNLEHLLGPARAAPFVAELLDRLPRLRILATSQHRPRRKQLPVLALGPLAMPPLADSGTTLPAAARSAAMQLFVSRARRCRADFALHRGNVAELSALCHALQGLPLAIELAATRVRELSPARMREALAADPTWPARKAPGRHAGERHASLRNAISWSLGLLTPQRRALLAALSVLQGPFEVLDAVGIGGLSPAQTTRALTALDAVSMLQAQHVEGPEPAAWLMLDALRQQVAADLSADAAARLRQRHREHFLHKAQSLAAHHRHASDRALPDFLHAADSALADGEPGTGAALLLALRGHWVARGAGERVLALMKDTARHADLGLTGVAELHALRAQLLVEVGQAEAAGEAAAEAQAAAPNEAVRLEADLAAAHVRWRTQREADTCQTEARQLLTRAQEGGKPMLIGRAAMLLGAATWTLNPQDPRAPALFRQAQAAFEAAGDAHAALTVLPGLTACLLVRAQGQAQAIALCAEGVEQANRLGHVHIELQLLNRINEACARRGRHAQALAAAQRQARLARRHGMTYHLLYALWNQGYSLARLGQAESAALLMAFSSRWWAADFGPLQAEDQRFIGRVREQVTRRLGAIAWQDLWTRGEALPMAEGIALGCGARGPI